MLGDHMHVLILKKWEGWGLVSGTRSLVLKAGIWTKPASLPEAREDRAAGVLSPSLIWQASPNICLSTSSSSLPSHVERDGTKWPWCLFKSCPKL